MAATDPEQDLPLDEWVEAAPGLQLRRRGFLKTAAATLAAAAAPGTALAALRGLDDSAGSLSLEEFLVVVAPAARELVADTTAAGQDRYLHTLARHAVRLAEVAEPASWRDSGQGVGPGSWIGVHPGGDPFVVLDWKLEPGAVIRPHAHTYGHVCTVGLAGRARLRNYETVEAPDYEGEGPFAVRLTREQRLGPGDINLVSLERDFVHGFEAGPEGARGLDLTTRIRERRPTPYLVLETEPTTAGRAPLTARWHYD